MKPRFTSTQDSLKSEIAALKQEIQSRILQRDDLVRIGREEADGTGGSNRKNLGLIYKIKRENAEAAERELAALKNKNEIKVASLETRVNKKDSTLTAQIAAISKAKADDPAARIEAMSRLTDQNSAMWWAEWFIIVLFIALETAPVFVKLISAKGPYNNLLKAEEYRFAAVEVEELARINAEIKERNSGIAEMERSFITERLDAVIKDS